MKLIRFGNEGSVNPGLQLDNNTRIDVSAFGEDYNENFFATDGIARLKKWLETNQSSCPIVDNNTRLAAPTARPSKIVCVGLNYAKHAEESGMAQAYLSVWESFGSVNQSGQTQIETKLQQIPEAIVYPWPEITKLYHARSKRGPLCESFSVDFLYRIR